MSERAAPDGGYDFAEKTRYRSQLWSNYAFAVGSYRAYATALLMPSLEGLELGAAEQHGFRPSNLWAVDKNPAIVATLKRRHPQINTIGVEVSRCGFRFVEKSAGATLDIANLDMTGCVGPPLLSSVMSFASTRALSGASLVAVTCLRGRESGMTRDAIRDKFSGHTFLAKPATRRALMSWATPSDWGRLGMLAVSLRMTPALMAVSKTDVSVDTARALSATVACVSARYYKSGTQTMLWSLWVRVDSNAIMAGTLGALPTLARYARAQIAESSKG